MCLDEKTINIIKEDIYGFLDNKVGKIVQANFGHRKEYTLQNDFEKDLKFDSLDIADLVISAEDYFNLEIKEFAFKNQKETYNYLFDKIVQREKNYPKI